MVITAMNRLSPSGQPSISENPSVATTVIPTSSAIATTNRRCMDIDGMIAVVAGYRMGGRRCL